MKKIFAVFLSAAIIVLSLSSCSSGGQSSGNSSNDSQPEATECDHDWSEATCYLPKTCTKCGITEGEALGHSMINNICTRCGYSEWSVKNFGFYDLDKCNTFLKIGSYNLANKVIKTDRYNYHYYQRYQIIEFHDTFYESKYIYDNGENKTGRTAISIVDNDRILCIYDNLYITIYDKVVINEKNNTLILKCLVGGSEEWYLSYDAVDWSITPEKITEKDKEGLKFKLK